MIHLNKYVDNLQFKIFEDKQEKQPDQQWARSLSDPHVFNALPLTQARKMFKFLTLKEA